MQSQGPHASHSKDYYYILGIAQDASDQQIRAAYNDLCDKFGPHVSAESMDTDVQARTYRDINEAYEILSNPDSRRKYDETYAQIQKSSDVRALWGMMRKKRPGHNQENSLILPRYEDQGNVEAVPYNLDMEISLKEAVKGTLKEIMITDPLPCQRCLDKKPLERMQCDACRGLGYCNVDRLVSLELGPGLYDGLVITKPKLGKFDLKVGRHGDLVVKIKLRKHPVLQVVDKDIRCHVPISICEAVLGAEIQIPTAAGKVTMKIQPLTHQGRVYRLKGLGLAGGDMLVVINIAIPKRISPEEVKLYRQLSSISGSENPREEFYRTLDSIR